MSAARPVALVTGGARRIGAVIVQSLHERGYNVLLHYHSSQNKAQTLAAECNAQRADSVHCLGADLCDADAVRTLGEEVTAHTKRLDLLVNNASNFYTTTWGEISDKDWDALIGSNIRGSLFLTQALTPLLKQTQGNIVNISDHLPSYNLRRYPLYSLAKGALNTATYSLALCLAPQVRVNAVALGAILPQKEEAIAGKQLRSEIPMGGAVGDAKNVADVVCFLASARARYITGQLIPVDGGRHLMSGSI